MTTDIQLRQEFIEKLRFTGKSNATIAQYTPKLRHFAEFIAANYALSVDSLTDIQLVKGHMLSHYQQTLRERELSPSLEMAHISAIKSFFSWLDRFGYVDKNPSGAFLTIRVPKTEQVHFEWSEAEEIMRKYESWNTERDLAILGIGFTMGLRASSIVALNIGDIGRAGEDKLIYRNKGGGQKSVYVPAPVMAAIRRYMELDRHGAQDSEPLFISRNGNRIHRATITEICKRGGQLVGKPGTAHAMRRTCLTRIYEVAGISAAKLMGAHESEHTTKGYLYPSEGQMNRIYDQMGIPSFSPNGND